jgi:hypothetical protein
MWSERKYSSLFQEFLIEAGQFLRNLRPPRTQACGTRPATPTFILLEKIDRPAA